MDACNDDSKRWFADGIAPDCPLSDSGFTLREIISILLESCEQFKKEVSNGKRIRNISTKDIGEGRSHMSTVYKVAIEFEHPNCKPFSFVMKVPTTEHQLKVVYRCFEGDALKAEVERVHRNLAQSHAAECGFYKRFGGAQVLPLADVWYTREITTGTRKPGLIVMEDLSDAGAPQNVMESASLQQVKNVAHMLAKFHAMQLTSRKDGPLLKEGGNYHINDAGDGVFDVYWPKLVALDPDHFGPLTEKLRPLNNRTFAKFALVDRPKQLGFPSILCHGDLKTPNMLFKRRLDGSPSNDILAVLDWQVVFYGNPMFDLVRFVTLCADAEVRREAEEFLIELYTSELFGLLTDTLDASVWDAFSLANLHELYDLALIQQAIENSVLVAVRADKIAATGSSVFEAEVAKFALRNRLLMEDAVKRMESRKDLIRSFLDDTISESPDHKRK